MGRHRLHRTWMLDADVRSKLNVSQKVALANTRKSDITKNAKSSNQGRTWHGLVVYNSYVRIGCLLQDSDWPHQFLPMNSDKSGSS